MTTWIKWDGGVHPIGLKPYDIVEVNFRDTSYDADLVCNWMWNHNDEADDIVQYRIATDIGHRLFKAKHNESIFNDPSALGIIYHLKNRGISLEQVIAAFISL